MSIINQLTIKHKTYVLVFLIVAVAVILSFVSNNGLKLISLEFDDLIFASKIERYTNQLFVEEQKYRLNANGSRYNHKAANQAYNNTLRYIDKIYLALSERNDRLRQLFLQDYQQRTKDSTDKYKRLYLKAVALLNGLNTQAGILVFEGNELTRQIQKYVEAKRVEIKQDLTQSSVEKINNGSNIWQFTYVIRLHEETYRLSPSDEVLNKFKKDYQFMMTELQRLKAQSDQVAEFEILDQFVMASTKYQQAMLLWVDLHQQLINDVLPKMEVLGNKVIENAVQVAENSVNRISKVHERIVITLFIVSGFTIIFGIFLGSLIARSITVTIYSFKRGLLNFFQYLNQHKNSVQLIKVEGKNEISLMAEVVNAHIIKVQNVLQRKKRYHDALLEWSKVDYQDDVLTLQQAAKLSAKALNIERVSIWLVDNETKKINCAISFQASLNTNYSKYLFVVDDYSEFFNLLVKGESIVLDDTSKSIAAVKFYDNYLKLLNIVSILYMPIINEGVFLGFIAYEKIAETKSWASDEIDFASSMVAAISLSLEIKKRRIAEVAIIEAKELADFANQAKSEFLANMSHELRTPMHGILSFASLGLNHATKITTEKHMQYYKNIKISAVRLMNLLNDLLDISKLEAGKMEMNFAHFSLQSIVESCVSEQSARLENLNLKLCYESNNIKGEGLFDDLRIGQVITNLLSNAIKFSPENSKIIISIRQTELVNNQKGKIAALFFSVRDQGKGIKEGEQQQIFGKFEQGSESKQGTTKGTGLGLSISKKIISLHHGHIYAENYPQGGAVFSFIIPLTQQQA